MVFYRNLVSAALEWPPGRPCVHRRRDGRVRDAGRDDPGFTRKAARIAQAGIYDLRIHHDEIVQPLLRHGRIRHRWLDAEGELARDELAATVAALAPRPPASRSNEPVPGPGWRPARRDVRVIFGSSGRLGNLSGPIGVVSVGRRFRVRVLHAAERVGVRGHVIGRWPSALASAGHPHSAGVFSAWSTSHGTGTVKWFNGERLRLHLDRRRRRRRLRALLVHRRRRIPQPRRGAARRVEVGQGAKGPQATGVRVV